MFTSSKKLCTSSFVILFLGSLVITCPIFSLRACDTAAFGSKLILSTSSLGLRLLMFWGKKLAEVENGVTPG